MKQEIDHRRKPMVGHSRRLPQEIDMILLIWEKENLLSSL